MKAMLDRLNIELKRGSATGEVLAPCEFKASNDGTVIEGYGAVFGSVDQGFDVVQAGAFFDSIKAGVKPKMLWQHRPSEPIGVWDEFGEDETGLRVKGRLLLDVAAGKEAAALVKNGAIEGLSIGYRTIESRKDNIDGCSVRVIEKAELWEVSLVTFPMNPEATIDAVKAADMTEREFEAALRDAGMSRSVRAALMHGGFKSVQALRDAGEEDFSELLEAVQASTLLNSLS
jgi:HK97 family phage prohead protease